MFTNATQDGGLKPNLSSQQAGVETERQQTKTSEGRSSGKDAIEASKEYNERAAALWAEYVQEAESHDKALIEGWKDDMGVVITFAGLFSATVTTFLVASYPNLQPDPPTQTETLTEQTVFLLSVIATQLGANITLLPPAPSTHLESFTPAASDVRDNACWSISLVLSLTAALLATIVQQWVRDYMHLYQRYSSNLKRARIRQYLFEGADKHKISVLVDAIPTLIHGSLFLFFGGLCDLFWQINHTVAILTTVSMVLAPVFYAYTVVAPVMDAQSPYQSPLSGVFWYFFRVFRRRTKSTGGVERQISSNMSDGRVQLAMDHCDSRRQRDARAICWVVDNLTEDTELEPFISGIPGSLSTQWGMEVWAEAAKPTDKQRKSGILTESGDAPHNSSHLSSTNSMLDLSGRITRLLRTCLNPDLLEPRPRRQRARACVDAALSLVLNVKTWKWQWLAHKEIMAKTLRYLADPANHPPDRGQDVHPFADSAFRHRWIFMSIVTVHALLQDSRVRDSAISAIQRLAAVSGESDTVCEDVAALKSSVMLDEVINKAWHAGSLLRDQLDTATDTPQELLEDILERQNTNVTELESCYNILAWAEPVDNAMRSIIQAISEVTEHIITLLPGASVSTSDASPLKGSSDMYGLQDTMLPHFLLPVTMISRLTETARRLRNIQSATWDAQSPKPGKLVQLSPDELYTDDMRRRMSAIAAGREGVVKPFREQLWRLQDLAVEHGGTLYVLDLLFNAVRSTSVKYTPEIEERYVRTFTVVTANWRQRCDSEAFQAGLVVLLRDVLWSDNVGTAPPLPRLPLCIVEEMIRLVSKVLRGSNHPHAYLIDEAVDVVGEFSSITGIPVPTKHLVHVSLMKLKPPCPRPVVELNGTC